MFFFKCMKFKCSENFKSSSIYFVVQRITPFTDYDVPITFGVCINTTTGFFIAPKSGTYFFSWREEHGDRSRLTFHSTNNLQINDVVSMQIYLPVDKWRSVLYANERAPHFTQFMGWMLQKVFSYSQWSSGK